MNLKNISQTEYLALTDKYGRDFIDNLFDKTQINPINYRVKYNLLIDIQNFINLGNFLNSNKITFQELLFMKIDFLSLSKELIINFICDYKILTIDTNNQGAVRLDLNKFNMDINKIIL